MANVQREPNANMSYANNFEPARIGGRVGSIGVCIGYAMIRVGPTRVSFGSTKLFR